MDYRLRHYDVTMYRKRHENVMPNPTALLVCFPLFLLGRRLFGTGSESEEQPALSSRCTLINDWVYILVYVFFFFYEQIQWFIQSFVLGLELSNEGGDFFFLFNYWNLSDNPTSRDQEKSISPKTHLDNKSCVLMYVYIYISLNLYVMLCYEHRRKTHR